MARPSKFLSISLAVITVLVLRCESRKTRQTNVTRSESTLASVDTAGATEDSNSARFYVYEAGKMRDPFVKPGTGRKRVSGGPVEQGPPPMKLEIILYDEANPLAMINGQSVHLGDKISGATISSILKDRVIIEYNGKTYTKFLE